MPKFNADALLFGLAWAALAVFAFIKAGYLAGAILSVGLLIVIMPVSSLILDRTGNLRTERVGRWAVLLLAAIGFAIYSLI